MLVKHGKRIDRVHNKDPRGMRLPRKKLAFSEPRPQAHRCLRNITPSSAIPRASPFRAAPNSSIPTISPLLPLPPFLFLVLPYVKLFRKGSYSAYPLDFSPSVHRKWKKTCSYFSSKWGNISNKWETCNRKLLRSLVSEMNPVEFGMSVDS